MASGDAAGGRRYVRQQLLFDPPKIAGLAPQEVIGRLRALSDRLWPEESKGAARIEDMRADAGEWEGDTADTDLRRVSFDRMAALEAVNRALTEIDRRLARDDEATARRFLTELIEKQRKQPIPDRHLHIAKTLAKAATMAQDHGLYGWGEELFRAAVQENANDQVAANGLADVLKAQGDLAGAERQYRKNRERFPNDEVAANGLADVLKAQGDLAGAEAQYRDNISRFPNDEVAASGLADVLKAQGDLAGAEAQYRDNISRFPNNEVAASGLADVLKAQGDLAGAERQYRENISRWPNDRVSRNGLANVLRRQGRAAEALQRVPMPEALNLEQDFYDLHVHALLLLDLGRIDEARAALERGLAEAAFEKDRALFARSLVLVELKRGEYRRARERLDALPGSVVPLQLFRLHAAAGSGDVLTARRVHGELEARRARLDPTLRQVLEEIEQGFCLTAGEPCEPDEATQRAIFDAEIEMAWAA